jgi:hypothetical protein
MTIGKGESNRHIQNFFAPARERARGYGRDDDSIRDAGSI